MSFAMNRVPAGSSEIAVPSSLYVQPLAGIDLGTSSSCTRCVSVALLLSSVAAG